MVKVVFPSSPSGHHYIPIRLHLDTLSYDGLFLFDTGATCCSIPKSLNDSILHLPIIGRDEGIETAQGETGLDFVEIRRMQILRYVVKIKSIDKQRLGFELGFKETGLTVENVKTWLCESDDSFIVGTNFFSRFNVRKDKKGQLHISD